jgi:hypothetical protein
MLTVVASVAVVIFIFWKGSRRPEGRHGGRRAAR